MDLHVVGGGIEGLADVSASESSRIMYVMSRRVSFQCNCMIPRSLTSEVYFHCAAQGSKVVVDPCTPQGLGGPDQAETKGDTSTTVKGMGNFTACRAQSLALLQQGQGLMVNGESHTWVKSYRLVQER